MTMPYSPSRAVYEGNDAATRFPFSFKVWNASQLVVTLTSPDGATSVASGWTADIGASGGEIVYLHEAAPLPAGWKLAVTRNMPFTQDVNLVSASRFDPQVIEDALDQAAAERQQTLEMMRRAVILPATSDESPQDVVQAVYTARDDAQNASSSAQAAEAAAWQRAAQAATSANTAAQVVLAAADTVVSAATAQAAAAASSAAAAAQSAIDAAAVEPGNLAKRVTDVESATSAAQSTANTAKAVTDTVTPTPTAYAVPKAGADGKINKNWLSLDPPYNPYPSLSGTASFVGATNTITMSNIVSTLSLEVGDVIAFGGDANTNNKRLRTVEGVLNDNTIVVNYEHCGNRGNGSRKLSDQSGVSVTCTRIAKWYSAPDSLGRSWIVLPASLRATDTTYTNSTGRPFFMTRMTTNSAGTSLWIDGVIISGAVYANGGMNTASAVITSGSTYKTNGTLYVWAELR